MGKRILEAVLSTIALLIVSSIVNLLALSTYNPELSVLIGDVQRLTNDEYILQINIKNNTKNIINDILVQLPIDMNTSKVLTSNSISLTPIKNSNSQNRSSTIEINNLLGDQGTSLTFITKSDYNSNDVLFSTINKRIKVSNFNENSNEFKNYIFLGLLVSLIPAIIYGLQFYFTEVRMEKRKLEKDELIKQLNNDRDILVKQQEILEQRLLAQENSREALNQDLKEVEIKMKKEEFILRARIREYDKELNFWRDTIRKILYSTKNTQHDEKSLFKLITDSLGTNRTNCRDNVCIDNIEAMSELIKEKEF